eukprot:ctg_2837.g784
MQTKRFVKRARGGMGHGRATAVTHVSRDHYLRDDLPIPPAPTLARQLLVPDSNVLLHALSVLEHAALKEVVYLQTVMEEVRKRDAQVYERVQQLLASPDAGARHLYRFSNEHCRGAYVERRRGESPNDYYDRLIRSAVRWMQREIDGDMGAASSVVLLTEDRENARRARDQDGLVAISLVELADRVDGDDADLRERIRRAGESIRQSTVSATGAVDGAASVSVPEHWSAAEVERGIESGWVLLGTYRHMHMLHASGVWCRCVTCGGGACGGACRPEPQHRWRCGGGGAGAAGRSVDASAVAVAASRERGGRGERYTSRRRYRFGTATISRCGSGADGARGGGDAPQLALAVLRFAVAAQGWRRRRRQWRLDAGDIHARGSTRPACPAVYATTHRAAGSAHRGGVGSVGAALAAARGTFRAGARPDRRSGHRDAGATHRERCGDAAVLRRGPGMSAAVHMAGAGCHGRRRGAPPDGGPGGSARRAPAGGGGRAHCRRHRFRAPRQCAGYGGARTWQHRVPGGAASGDAAVPAHQSVVFAAAGRGSAGVFGAVGDGCGDGGLTYEAAQRILDGEDTPAEAPLGASLRRLNALAQRLRRAVSSGGADAGLAGDPLRSGCPRGAGTARRQRAAARRCRQPPPDRGVYVVGQRGGGGTSADGVSAVGVLAPASVTAAGTV